MDVPLLDGRRKGPLVFVGLFRRPSSSATPVAWASAQATQPLACRGLLHYAARVWSRPNECRDSPDLMSPADTGLLVVDVQDKLIRLVPGHQRIVWNIGRLIDGSQLFKLPILATEQYPKGLGRMVGELAAKLGSIAAKTTFSCTGCGEIAAALGQAAPAKWLVAGIETHVCVQQTVLDLLSSGFRVYVAVDAVGWRLRHRPRNGPVANGCSGGDAHHDRSGALRMVPRRERAGIQAAYARWLKTLCRCLTSDGGHPHATFGNPAADAEWLILRSVTFNLRSSNMSDFPPLNPPTRILLGPGPSDVHPRVLAALGAGTVGHLDPYYLELMNGMQRMLREVLRTENVMTLAVSGTGSAGMEAAVVNLIEPGDAMLVCVNGVFGARMADVAGRAGATVTRVDRPWGEVFAPDDLRKALADSRPQVVGIVMAETSTGAGPADRGDFARRA